MNTPSSKHVVTFDERCKEGRSRYIILREHSYLINFLIRVFHKIYPCNSYVDYHGNYCCSKYVLSNVLNIEVKYQETLHVPISGVFIILFVIATVAW